MIVAGRLVLADGAADGWLRLDGDRIADAGRGRPPGAPDVEAPWIAPGLVDLQVNGGAGVEVTEGDAALERVDAALLRAGVTGYLATVITTDDETAAATVASVAARRADTATPLLGVHLEGPFLSPRQPGVHRPELLREPAAGVPAHFDDEQVRLVTLAPELAGATDLVRRLAERGTVVSLGHSAATAAEADAAVAAGAKLVTHLFNAMPPFHHRDPGLAGWALGRSDIALSVIPDGHHVHPDALRLAVRAAGGRLVVVSDASVGALAPEGRYRQAGVDVVRHGDGRVTTVDGGLAGSGIAAADGVRLLAGLGVPADEALRMASWRPAALLGRTELLAPGAPADLVLLDEALAVSTVVFRGEVVPG